MENSDEKYELSLDEIFSNLNEDNGEKKKLVQPFKFLDSYSRDDKEIFFGRTEETEDIYRKFYNNKLLLIYGRSGTGKSSVVNCGLLNKIPTEDIYPIIFRPGKNPYGNFVAELKKHTAEPSNDPKELILKIIKSQSKPLALIFDQFEEIFILAQRDERIKMMNVLKLILSLKEKNNIVIIIREEYLANLTEFESTIPDLFRNRIRIEKMDHSIAISVIEKPCQVCGIRLEEGVSESIIERLTDKTGSIELTYLQVMLDRLYKKAIVDGNSTIKLSHLDELKSIGNVLTQFLDEQLSEMPDAEIGEKVLKTLISSDGTKHRMTAEEIYEDLKTTGNQTDQKQLNEILQYFVNVRVITEKDENNTYELRHDALAAGIFERLTAFEKELAEVKKFIENAFYSFQKRKKYLDIKDLKYLAAFEDKLYLKPELKHFITDSKRQVNKAKKRKNLAFIFMSAILFIVLSGFTIWAMNEKRKAQFEKKKADLAYVEIEKKNFAFFYQQAQNLKKNTEYDEAIKQLMSAKRFTKDTLMLNAEIEECKSLDLKVQNFKDLMNLAKEAFKNELVEEAYTLYEEASETPSEKEKLIAELKELKAFLDKKNAEYNAQADAVRNLNPSMAGEERKKASRMLELSKKTERLIFSLQ